MLYAMTRVAQAVKAKDTFTSLALRYPHNVRFMLQISNMTIDLDDLFSDIYYMDLPGAPPAPAPEDRTLSPQPVAPVSNCAAPAPVDPEVGSKRTAAQASLKTSVSSSATDPKDLTEAQKIERRERNREHAKRSRLRKKFLLESLQEQIHGLEEQIDRFKASIKQEIPHKAEEIIKNVCGDKEKFTPLPMPSGFGPVKTLMEPDFRLSK